MLHPCLIMRNWRWEEGVNVQDVSLSLRACERKGEGGRKMTPIRFAPKMAVSQVGSFYLFYPLVLHQAHFGQFVVKE